MNPNRCSFFVPESGRLPRPRRLTFGRASHRRLLRGYAARSAGGNAPPGVASDGTATNRPGRSRRGCDGGGMGRKAGQPRFFTERTLADYLSVSDRTVRNWIRRGELPSYKLGAARRIDPADVEDFLARHRDEAA